MESSNKHKKLDVRDELQSDDSSAISVNIEKRAVSNLMDSSKTGATGLRHRWRGIWFLVRLLEVRLRFVAVLVALGLIIGYWETLQNYWDRWTRPQITSSANAGSDTEFYCPMDPAVVRSSLEPNGSIPKCPICNMPLSTRKKGVSMALPPGVVGRVSLSPEKVRMAGIRTAEISLRPLKLQIRTVGVVSYNQSKQSQIVSRVGGYLEKLIVDKTFVQVRQGDPLAEIYSPDLYEAIQELRISTEIANHSLAKIAREKISLLGIDDREIEKMLSADGTNRRVIVRSPATGFVIRKEVQQGSNVSAGQMLFEIADLSSVWIEADIFERDIALLHEDQQISAAFDAYPERTFKGVVGAIYPELQTATRTNRVRFEVDNPELLLRPGMYATIILETSVQQTEPFASELAFARLPPKNAASAIARQAVCPVTGAKLGSMGDPIPAVVNDRTVYLCCTGCTTALNRRPEYYVSRVQRVSNAGVLSVPESAVIDTGSQKLVYAEREEGLYEGVEVVLGPRSAGFYAVISGLSPGDRVAAAGAFLIDAETRLNPAASAAYFGASGSPTAGQSDRSSSGMTQFPPTEPADGNSTVAFSDLGQIGLQFPPTEPADGNSSDGRSSSLSANSGNLVNASPSRFTKAELENISQLGLADQKLARLQVLCPITEEPLGSMGVPRQLIVGKQPVLICCEGCRDKALSDAATTLAKVNRWRLANGEGKQ